jgi:hypothetical protein
MPERVAPTYVHRDKQVLPGPLLTVGPRRLKWYDVAAPDLPVQADVHASARTFLIRTNLDQLGELGFVVLHRCGEHFHFLLACSWKGNNEAWESVYAKDAGDADFRDYPHSGPHRGTYCVWEMGAVAHEARAWRRYLLSARDDTALTAWFADQYEGAI